MDFVTITDHGALTVVSVAINLKFIEQVTIFPARFVRCLLVGVRQRNIKIFPSSIATFSKLRTVENRWRHRYRSTASTADSPPRI